jgi:hypothetical protein
LIANAIVERGKDPRFPCSRCVPKLISIFAFSSFVLSPWMLRISPFATLDECIGEYALVENRDQPDNTDWKEHRATPTSVCSRVRNLFLS